MKILQHYEKNRFRLEASIESKDLPTHSALTELSADDLIFIKDELTDVLIGLIERLRHKG